MRLTASQLAALVDGMDWSRLHAHNIARPTATRRGRGRRQVRLAQSALPLYRQAQVMKLQGLPIDRSTLAFWVALRSSASAPIALLPPNSSRSICA